jgi:hypothetical protein
LGYVAQASEVVREDFSMGHWGVIAVVVAGTRVGTVVDRSFVDDFDN